MTQDTNTASGAAIKRYKIGYHTDEWGVRSSTPGGITDPSGQWVLYKDHIAALASHGQAPAQAAPAAVSGPSEAVKFTDQSTADPVEKACRYLTAMGDQHANSAYFYDDGYPRLESAQDALATLAVLEQLAAAPATQPAPQQAVQEPAYPSLPPADEVVHPRTSEPYALWGLIKLMDYAKAYHAVNAPQPVEREPLTDEQWQRIADLTDSILTRATKDEIERVIGIKGGQNADT